MKICDPHRGRIAPFGAARIFRVQTLAGDICPSSDGKTRKGRRNRPDRRVLATGRMIGGTAHEGIALLYVLDLYIDCYFGELPGLGT
jgi:hypothetical protein